MIQPSSREDIPYDDYELTRSVGSINGDFMAIDREGPIGAAITAARAKGRVALLDAGCGAGVGLMGLKGQIVLRTELTENDVEAVGVSLVDYRDRVDTYDIGWRGVKKLASGYIDLTFGNLSSIDLPKKHFDVAYAYQVLLHNDTIAPIIRNVLPTLSSGGIFYFDTLVEQNDEMESLTSDLPKSEWHVESTKLTRTFIHGTESRMMHKIANKL
jgi:SAM-dependent methyltransferase